jgi:HlyD family secretion protein
MREVYAIERAGGRSRAAAWRSSRATRSVGRDGGCAHDARGRRASSIRVSTPRPRAAVAAAEARLRAATAERELAGHRGRSAPPKLAEARLVADAARDTARCRAWRAAMAARVCGERELRRAPQRAARRRVSMADLATVMLRAPVAGVVLGVPQKSEAIIGAGTPVVVLGDPAKVDVVAEFLRRMPCVCSPGDARTSSRTG